jgi:hypothetical protein
MAHKHKGKIVSTYSWRKHLRKHLSHRVVGYKRYQWSLERQAEREILNPLSSRAFRFEL